MAHGATPTQTVRARVRGERLADRFAHSFSWKRMGSRLLHIISAHILARTKRDATAQYDDDDA